MNIKYFMRGLHQLVAYKLMSSAMKIQILKQEMCLLKLTLLYDKTDAFHNIMPLGCKCLLLSRTSQIG